MAAGDDDDLELTDDQALPDDDEQLEAGEGQPEDGETIITFDDEADDEADEPALVKKLRDEIRARDRTIAQIRRTPANAANDTDPEPDIPPIPDIEEFNYDRAPYDAAVKARDEAVAAHAEWRVRQNERQAARDRVADEQTRQIEQQKKALGVSDYEERSSVVKESLSDAQLAILVNGASNPARLIYALGRSPAKLAQIGAEDNLAKFAVMIGGLEKEIKVTKRSAPAVDTPVRGATGSAALLSSDKKLAELEKKAEKTGDRTAVVAYKRQLRQQGKAA